MVTPIRALGRDNLQSALYNILVGVKTEGTKRYGGKRTVLDRCDPELQTLLSRDDFQSAIYVRTGKLRVTCYQA